MLSDLELLFSRQKFETLLSRKRRELAKRDSTSFVDFYIQHLVAPLRKFDFMTLTYILKVKSETKLSAKRLELA